MPFSVDKLSNQLTRLLPGFVQEESAELIAFLKAYFEYLEMGVLTLKSQEELDFIGLEAETGNILFEDAAFKPSPKDKAKIVFEQNSNNATIGATAFTAGEYIYGQSSGALATIRVIGDNKLYIEEINTRTFEPGETIIGRTSEQKAIVNTFSENSIAANNNILKYADIDTTIGSFLSYFQKDFMPSIDFSVAADKRLLIKHVKELYQRKGTKESLEFLMRILYQQDAEVAYPIENTLHASESSWNEPNVIQVFLSNGQPPNNGKIIKYSADGVTIEAEAIIENVYFDPADETAYRCEISINHLGTFAVDDSVSFLDRDNNTVNTGTVRGVIGGVDLDHSSIYLSDADGDRILLEDGAGLYLEGGNAGSLYSISDQINFASALSDDAIDATSQINGLTSGGVTEIYVEDGGTGYSSGDLVVFDDAGTNGSGAFAEIESVGDQLLLESGTQWGHFVFTATNGQTIFEGHDDLHQMMAFDAESVIVYQNDVKLTSGYNVFVNKIVLSSGAALNDKIEVYAYLNNILFEDNTVLGLDTNQTEIRKVIVASPGYGYQFTPLAYPGGFMYFNDVTGFQKGEIITGSSASATGLIIGVDTDLNRLTIGRRSSDTGAFSSNDTITGGTSSTTATIITHNVTSGEGAILLTYGDNIGGIASLRMQDAGNKYDESGIIDDEDTIITMLVTTPSDTPPRDGTLSGDISGVTATIVDYNSNRHILKVKNLSGPFLEGETCTFSSTESLKVAKFRPLNARGQLVGETRIDGNFLNDYGYTDASGMAIHDSLYYQTHSYVVKIGESINRWRSIVKDLVHPTGHIFFGEVAIRSDINAQATIYNRVFDGTNVSRSFVPTLYIGSKVDALGIIYEDYTWDALGIDNEYSIGLENEDGLLRAERYYQEGSTVYDQVTGQGFVVGTDIVEDTDDFYRRIVEAEARMHAKHDILIQFPTLAADVSDESPVLQPAGAPNADTDPRTDGSITEPGTEYGDSGMRNRHVNIQIIQSIATASAQVGTRIDQDSGTATTLRIDYGDSGYLTRNTQRAPANGKVIQSAMFEEERMLLEDGNYLLPEEAQGRMRYERTINANNNSNLITTSTILPPADIYAENGDEIILEDGSYLGLETATVTEVQEYFITERTFETSKYLKHENYDKIVTEDGDGIIMENSGDTLVTFARVGPTIRTLELVSQQQVYDISYYIVDESEDNILLEDQAGSLMSESSNSEGLRIADVSTTYANWTIGSFEEHYKNKTNFSLSAHVVSGE